MSHNFAGILEQIARFEADVLRLKHPDQMPSDKEEMRHYLRFFVDLTLAMNAPISVAEALISGSLSKKQGLEFRLFPGGDGKALYVWVGSPVDLDTRLTNW
jgi:hypothetical protein